ncbi:hypothetical protein [Rhizobium binxianense]|uniref:hypothetical protein n=1 Tax=Rhizobium binxianense TaxID=3024242 RepID=UPI0023616BB3|nr:hypothetical protein [Rhizobium sp. MJ37]MDC9836743.1 hypothetical protein [Rhizobium sp. MJ37]
MKMHLNGLDCRRFAGVSKLSLSRRAAQADNAYSLSWTLCHDRLTVHLAYSR